jgi:hypothetical protein
MIWVLVVFICTGSDCRVAKEFPMLGMNTESECQEMRNVEFRPAKGLAPGERIRTECQFKLNRWDDAAQSNRSR